MSEKMKASEIAKITGVDVTSVKTLMSGHKEMTIEDFKHILDANYDNLRVQLNKKDTFTNDEICKIFKCSLASGMARSHRTNSLVLISDTESKNRAYGDFWDGEVIHYTGMGKNGDQKLSFGQNKTLARSNELNIFMALFSKLYVDGKTVYVYRGEPKLLAAPYQEEENKRMVFRFILGFDREVEHTNPEIVNAIEEEKEKAITRIFPNLSPEEQRKRALAQGKKGKRGASKKPPKDPKKPFIRKGYVKEYAIARAKGICECCGKPGPFEVDGVPYLVCHHIKWLENNGDDTIFNTSGICPNCHSKVHVLNLPEDTERIIKNMKKDEKVYSGIDI